MKKTLKKLLIVLMILLLLFAAFLVAWVFLIYPRFVAPKAEAVEPDTGFSEIAAESEHIDFNESKGILYVNNEVVVFVEDGATPESISALFAPWKAQVDDTMGDIGLYKLVLEEAMSYEDLNALLQTLKADPIVTDAYLNTVTALETDEAEDFVARAPVYPDDPWNWDDWDVAVPRGEKWGMEAIDAPGAWGYLDQIAGVRVGLIDGLPNGAHPDLSLAKGSSLFIDEKTGKTNVNKYTLSPDDHGTHVSGTINGTWNNGTGVSGVMGGKGELYYSAVYYDSNGRISERYATAYTYLLALKTLIDQDVQVINISQNTSRLVGFAASHGNRNAINYLTMQADLTERGLSRIIAARTVAGKPDFLICVAAGNSNDTYYYKDDKEPYGYRETISTWESVKYLFGWRGEIGNSQALYNNFLSLMDDENVRGRVMVVGAVGIDDGSSTAQRTRYAYAPFSNIGSRVDIVAPGVDVYSCVSEGYDSYSGTSMATPHVSGAAGLVFGCNPNLTGPEVKEILRASTTGRYYHGSSYSGLLNANTAVVNALQTVDTSVQRVLRTETDSGLDLCFVVDTTGSMEDDIDNAKENMATILEHLAEKTENYRVALIDYRDYADRSGASQDYPCRVQLGFTGENEAITAAIHALDLGNGGDSEETVYSALMAAVELDWRADAKKVIIILGDAAPLDPEPVTGYTYDDVLLALFNADINIDYEESDERVVDNLDTSLINVFSIGTDASSDAADFFEDIATSTGGSYVGVEDASQVSDAIVESIEQIEVVEKRTVPADFGDGMANRRIDLYRDGLYLFTLETDEEGQCILDAMEEGAYDWSGDGWCGGGSISIRDDRREAVVQMTKTYWFSPLLRLWQENRQVICLVVLGYLALCIAVPVCVKLLRKSLRRRRAAAAARAQREAWANQVEWEARTNSSEQGLTVELPHEPVSQPPVIPESRDNLCPNCGCPVVSGARFCKRCGQNLQKSQPRICKTCGQVCRGEEQFCGNCGAKITED